MIDIETYNCGSGAEELEGDKFPFPATFALSTATPYVSADGKLYAESILQEEANAKYLQTWSFEGKP